MRWLFEDGCIGYWVGLRWGGDIEVIVVAQRDIEEVKSKNI